MRPRVLVAAALILSVASCSSPTEGQPGVVNSSVPVSSPETSGADLPSNGAPKVARPLSDTTLRALEGQPCQVLTPRQLQAIGVNPPGSGKEGEFGPICFWYNKESGAMASAYFPVQAISKGLSQYYNGRDETYRNGYFYAIQSIHGHPVIAAEPTDRRELGDCTLQVGLTDTNVMSVGVSLSDSGRQKSEPCTAARKVAEMMIATVQGIK